jgi:hypothetical protein
MKTANNNTAFATSIALTPTAVGNLQVLVIETKYAGNANRKVLAITGGGVTLWTNVLQRFMADTIHGAEVWIGVVTSVGSLTATVTYVSTIGQQAGSINGHELTAGTGSLTIWAVDKTGFNDPNTNATTFTYPALISANDGEAYVGYLAVTSSASAGSGSGWTYSQDLRGNWDAVNPAVGAAGTSASTSQTSGSGQKWFTVGVLISAAADPVALTGMVGTKMQTTYTGSNGRSLTCVGTLTWVAGSTQACVQTPSGYSAFDIAAITAASPSSGSPSDPH